MSSSDLIYKNLKARFTHHKENGELKKRFTTETMYWNTSEFCIAATNSSSGGDKLVQFIKDLDVVCLQVVVTSRRLR